MPWEVRKGAGSCRPEEFAVIKKSTGETVACHGSEEAAQRHMAALYANTQDAQKYSVVDLVMGIWEDTLRFAEKWNAERRRAAAKKGHALPDGGYPIEDEEDLRNAIQAFGRAGNPAQVKSHIIKRARALGKTDLLPESWTKTTHSAHEHVSVSLPQRTSYVVELGSVVLDENTMRSWVQALPLGTYEHPNYGTIDITPERIGRFAENVKAKVRDIDPDIDYDHKKYGGEAAGWVTNAEARDNGLWIEVEWTRKAFDLIKNKAYRYFSPEFQDVWEHPKTRRSYRDVLFGGGITNRPFLKDILPLNLSEVIANGGAVPHVRNQGGAEMDEARRKALAAKLSLSEDATEAQIFDALEKWEPAAPGGTGTASTTSGGTNTTVTYTTTSPVQPPVQQTAVQASDDPGSSRLTGSDLAALTRLAEGNEGVTRLVERLKDQQRELDARETALRLSEVNRRLDNASLGKNIVLSPVVRDELRELCLEVPKKFTDKIYKIVENLVSGSGLVHLGETSVRGDWRDGSGSAAIRFSSLVAEETKKPGVSYADAVETVASNHPRLFEEYRAESTAFVE